MKLGLSTLMMKAGLKSTNAFLSLLLRPQSSALTLTAASHLWTDQFIGITSIRVRR